MKVLKIKPENRSDFEIWWNQQNLSKVSSPGMELIVQTYKDIAKLAWDAGKAQYELYLEQAEKIGE